MGGAGSCGHGANPNDSLKRRYQLLLRCYPRRWRRAHGDALLTLLVDAAHGNRRPPIGDAANLVARGLSTRALFTFRWARDERALASATALPLLTLAVLAWGATSYRLSVGRWASNPTNQQGNFIDTSNWSSEQRAADLAFGQSLFISLFVFLALLATVSWVLVAVAGKVGRARAQRMYPESADLDTISLLRSVAPPFVSLTVLVVVLQVTPLRDYFSWLFFLGG